MGKKGQLSVTDVAYRPSLSAPVGVDVLDFAELVTRTGRRGLDPSVPMRPAFHHLIHVRSGSVRHTVDFRRYTLTPGCWLWVLPSQVHQYTPGDLAEASGTIVIWQPGFTPAEPPFDPSPVLPQAAHADAVDLALRHLAQEYADLASIPLDAHLETLRLLLTVLLVRLAHARPEPPSPNFADGTFHRFHAAVERDFARVHHVADYADTLGYSARTLTRATLAATGSTAKQYIDERILLEARRLLVHTDATSAEICHRLGFRDPSDFTKFFRKRDGRTPLDFRTTARGTAGAARTDAGRAGRHGPLPAGCPIFPNAGPGGTTVAVSE
jgi:AraC-like DNA-binding protein